MQEKIDSAIKILCDRINEKITPDEALKFTQSALNLAHVKKVLEMQDLM